MMTIAMTQAKIGRSMKMREITWSAARLRGGGALLSLGGRRLNLLRRVRRYRADRGVGLQLRGALHDHLIAGVQPIRHDPEGTLCAVGDDLALDGLVVGPDDIHGRRAPGIARDRGLGDEERVLVDRLREGRTDEHARQQQALRIGEAGAQRHRAGRLVDRHLGELDRAGKAVIAAVLQLQAHGRARRGDVTLLERPAQREQVRARLLDVDEHGVGPLDDRHRIGLVAADQRADRGQAASDASRDRGGNAREVQVDARRLQRGAVLGDGRLGLTLRGDSVGIVLLADSFGLGERAVALGSDARGFRSGGGAGEIGLRLVGRCLIEAGVDLVERLPGTDQRAFGEQATPDDAGHLRANFRRFECGGAAGQLGRGGDRRRLHDDEAHRDGPAGTALALCAAVRRLVAGSARGHQQPQRGDRARYS